MVVASRTFSGNTTLAMVLSERPFRELCGAIERAGRYARAVVVKRSGADCVKACQPYVSRVKRSGGINYLYPPGASVLCVGVSYRNGRSGNAGDAGWRILQKRRDPEAFDDRLNYEEVLCFRKQLEEVKP